MSIANDYANLADFCAGFALRGEAIPPRTAGMLANALVDLASQTKLLERSTLLAEPVVYACEHDGDGCD